MTLVPTSVEPVKLTFATRPCPTSVPPVVEPGPGSTEMASGGSPASTRISASASTERGVYVAGLTITVFPHASAGATFHEAMTSGKFHGVMHTQTPTGSRRVRSIPRSWIGIVSPKILFAAPAQYSSTLATRDISPRAETIGFPALRASSRARSSSRSRTSRAAFASTRPRSVALVLGQGPSS
jgi:hypothetical protein